MENLISMTDFVLEQKALKIMRLVKLQRIEKYANFIKQPLELWMFVPCVDNEVFNYSKHGNKEQYNEAKERCFFEGFEYLMPGYNKDIIVENKNTKKQKTINLDDFYYVEDLVNYNLTLTETAKKMLF